MPAWHHRIKTGLRRHNDRGPQMQGRLLRGAVFILLISAAGYSFANKISVEQIVQRHIQALGGRDNIDAVHSAVSLGEYREGTFIIPNAYVGKMRHTTARFAIPDRKWAR